MLPLGGGSTPAHLQHDVQQLGVVQPGITGPVDGTGAVLLGVNLQRFVAPRQGFGEHAGGRVGCEPIDGLLVASGNELSTAAQGRLEQIQFFASERAVGK